MRKRLKTLLVLCATLCLALFGAVFAACNDPDGGDTSVVYSVTVQNEDGDPLSGQFVQFCAVDDQGNEGVCYTPVETDENGVAKITVEQAQTMHVKLVNAPGDYEMITTTTTQFSYTIVVTEASSTVEYTFTVVDESDEPVPFTVITVKTGTKDYTGVTDNAGVAKIALDSGVIVEEFSVEVQAPTGYIYDGEPIVTATDNFAYTIVVATVGEGNFGTYKQVNVVEAGADGLSTVSKEDMYILSEVGTYDVKFEDADTDRIFYTFMTTTSGAYKLSILEDAAAAVKEVSPYNSGTASIFYSELAPLDDEGNIVENAKEVSFEIRETHVGALESSACSFVIELTGTPTYPAEFRIKVERTGDATPPATRVDVVVKAEEVPEAYEVPEGLLLEAPLTDPDGVVYNETDGYYHVGDANGPVLVAMLAAPSRYADASFLAFDSLSPAFDLLGDGIDPETNTYTVYRYVTYVDETAEILQKKPDSFVVQYVNACNADGVVPVTAELALFLQRYATPSRGGNGIYGGEVAEGCEWLIPCYYYQTTATELTYADLDTQPAKIGGVGYYTVTIPANGTAYFAVEGYRGYAVTVFNASATALFDGTTFKAAAGDAQFAFETNPLTYDDYSNVWSAPFAISNPSGEQIVVTFSIANGTFGTTPDQPYTMEEGKVIGVSYEAVPLYYTFTPDVSGLYAIRAYGFEQMPIIMPSEGEVMGTPYDAAGTDGFLYTVSLTAGRAYMWRFLSSLSAGADYSVVIARVSAVADGTGTAGDPYVIDAAGDYALVMPEGAETLYVKFADGVWNVSSDDYGFTYPSMYYDDAEGSSMYVGLTAGGAYTDPANTYYMEEGVIVTVAAPEPGSEAAPHTLEIGGPTTVKSGDWYTVTFEEEGFYTLYTTEATAVASVNDAYVASDARGFTYNMGGTEFNMETYEKEKLPVEAGVPYLIQFNDEYYAGIHYSVWLIEGERPAYDSADSGTGTEADPYVVTKPLVFRADIAANGAVWYKVNSQVRYTVTVEDANAKVTYGEAVYSGEEGTISFNISANDAAAGTATLKFETIDGTAHAYNFTLTEYVVTEPVVCEETALTGTLLTVGENAVTAGESFFEPAYYYFVPQKSGEYLFTATSDFTMTILGNWGEEEFYLPYDEGTPVMLQAGYVYEFCSYADGTVTIAEIETEYSAYTGTGTAEAPIRLGGVGGGIGVYQITIASNTTLNFSCSATAALKITADDAALSAVYAGETYAAADGEPFSFVTAAPMGFGTVNFTVTNPGNAAVTFLLTVTADYTITESGSGEPAVSDLQVGANTVQSNAADYWDSGTRYTFVADQAGTYTFTVTTEVANATVGLAIDGPYGPELQEGTTYTVELAAGESFNVYVAVDVDWNPVDAEVTITITKA